ncbi:unnamed protein product, partial [Bubo scandiacus]
MAGNLQAAARPGLAAGNDAQHNKVLQKQRAIKNTAKAAGARGGRRPAVPLGERRRLAADPGAQSPADWKRKRSAMEAGGKRDRLCGDWSASTPGASAAELAAVQPPLPRPGPAEPRPRRAAAPPKPVRACAGGAEPRRAGPGRAAPPGLAIRRRAAPPAGAGGGGGGALFLPGLPPPPPRTGLGKRLRRGAGAAAARL